MRRFEFFALAAVFASAVAGQESRPDPNDPKAKVPPVQYGSAFEGYRPFAEQEIGDWRKANEEVNAAGGHHATQRQKPAARPGASAPAAKDQAGHGGHK